MIYLKSKKQVFLLVLSIVFCSQVIFSADSTVPSEVEKEKDPRVAISAFPLGAYAMNSDGSSLYVAAYHEIKKSGNQPTSDFAVSTVQRVPANIFVPLAKEKVSINFESDNDNPLFNSHVKYLSLVEEIAEKRTTSYPVVVTASEPDKVYLINPHTQETLVGTSDIINDANEKPISEIVFLKGLSGLQGIASKSMVLAVKGNEGGEFGDPGSGITVLQFKHDSTKKNDDQEKKSSEESENKTEDVKNKPGEAEKKEEEPEKLKIVIEQYGLKSLPLDKSSIIAKIGSDLSSIKVADIHWDKTLNRLFIALQVEAGGNDDDGARALLVGRVEAEGFGLMGILASDRALTGNQSHIVAAKGKNAKVSLHKVRTMLSSNRLRYVVVLGGNGDSESTKRSVYALPLVVDYQQAVDDQRDKEEHKELIDYFLAHKNAVPEDEFHDGNIRSLKGRYLRTKAISKDSLFVSEDEAIQVGGGDMKAGDISDIFICSDAVFAVVGTPDIGEKSGIFMSRALFDDQGKIKRWSNWQRVATASENVFGASMDKKYGDLLMMVGAKENNVKTVRRTLWGNGDKEGFADLVDLLGVEFPKEIEGIQGLFEFSHDTQALKNTTLLVATGLKKIALVQLGYQNGLEFVPCRGDFTTDKVDCHTGAIQDGACENTNVVVVAGGSLDELGPITSAEVSDFGSGKLFVGGVGGVAVLVDATGNGWSVQDGLGPNFKNLKPGMSFKKIGDFRFVRKLISQDQFLYVLTDTILARIDLSDERNNFVTGDIKGIQLASLDTVQDISSMGTFFDFAISEKLGLLATSMGLFRVGNGQDIARDVDIAWTKIAVPAYDGSSVRQILPISKTNRSKDFAREGCDGMVYVLSSEYCRDGAQVNRFAVRAGDVDDATVLPLPDYFVEVPGTGVGSHSYFVNFGSFRKMINYDGAIRISASANNPDEEKLPLLDMLMPGIVSRQTLAVTASQHIPLNFEKDAWVSSVIRSSRGPLFIAGNFGLKVNE